MTSTPHWLPRAVAFFRGSQPVPPAQVKAAAEMIVNQGRYDINALLLKLQQNKIGIDEVDAAMPELIWKLQAANRALANGGFDNMTAKAWARVEQSTLEQLQGIPGKFAGWQGFKVDIVRGRYGPMNELNGAILSRGNGYANASRFAYENELKIVHKEQDFTHGRRILAAVENCPDCTEEADRGWILIEDMRDIGDSVCGKGGNCHCIQIFSRGIPSGD